MRDFTAGRVLALLLLALAAAPLAGRTARADDPHERYGAPPGEFDLYLLSLSWSPGFCDLEGERKGKRECAPGGAP